MRELIPTYFHINIPFYILMLLAIITGVYTYFYYRNTVPPISDKIKIILSISRGFAVFLILSLLFTPQVKLVWQSDKNPELIIAVDKSASMQIADNNLQRFEKANTILNYIEDNLKSTNDIHTFYFDTDTIHKNDSITVGKLGTNIDHALNTISKRYTNAESIILISDGIITKGSNPLFDTGIKKNRIHVVGIGDTLETPDILIKNVNANKTVYKNNPTVISAEITTKNLKNIETNVKLIQDNKVIAAKRIKVANSDELIDVNFEITPGKTGDLKYTVEVDEFKSEKLLENNNYHFQIEVLKNKLKIGLLANQPSYDVKFIKQILKSEKNFLLSGFTRIKPSTYNKSLILSIIDSSDVLIFFDFPDSNIESSLFTYLLNNIDKRRIPILLFVHDQLNRFSSDLLKTRFPDIRLTNNQQFINAFAMPSISGKLNSVFNIFDNIELNEAFWHNTAPIEYSFKNVNLGKSDNTLIYVKENTNLPILVKNSYKGLNNLLFLGQGFWRWKFLFAEDRQFANSFDTFIINLIKWISKNPNKKNINIEVNNKGLPLGEELVTNIQLYDAAYNPVDDGDIKLEIEGPGGKFEAKATNSGNGIYTWHYIPFTEGTYKIKATAFKNDVFIGINEIEINVLPVNNEFNYIQQDVDFLKKLAFSTGGQYFTEDNYKDIISLIPKSPQVSSISINYDLWNKLYTLILIILLLSIEWFIRKRKGLA